MDLARKHPGTTAAEDSLLWVCTHIYFHQNAEEAKRVLIRARQSLYKLLAADTDTAAETAADAAGDAADAPEDAEPAD